ncbi:hypothetical protein A2690_04435 [Candidatus Roizmanbacteria bacterium RIFCSPHIGHO2_01_FULL_39_12b]|uniref:AAA+ ATPase domain-containing protein n=1 Tax=Candidatus Roizmanbacteria bacterium RIFCSPHIGHO2_01_FULL_39_12b TaxID=1802030 RepID=A0A1F7GAG7_9BACT|nr:MAG: hypothetical protein A2690_04435 [Candidatus Roizmanbacteria bacterium RIFCSPHIGHO2_01_FULL_39_12b]
MSRYFRHIQPSIIDHFKKYKEIIILLGPRQAGKTTLVKNCFSKAHYLSVDNETTRSNLERYDITAYQQFIPADTKYLIIDEIHLLTNPGRAAKIIYDQMQGIKLIVTGSSSFNIKHKVTESLAGRKIDYHLYPLTLTEFLYQKGLSQEKDVNIINRITAKKTEDRLFSFDFKSVLDNLLIYGSYPMLVDRPNDQIYLKNLVDSVIFRDLLDLNSITNRQAALNLLRLLAYQIGSLVNISELSNRLNISVETVRRYLYLFEQSYIIFSLKPYAKSGRDEIGKMSKYYFHDLGIRNALIDNFNLPSVRGDFGSLFENFIISEVLKANVYQNLGYKMNFWRNKQGSEIDLIMQKNDELLAIEIKTKKRRINLAFKNRYPEARHIVLTRDNFY